MTRFLDGVTVLELGNFITGPYAGLLLAELGASVIKVERPDGGDPFRNFSADGYSAQFCAYNRGKRSLAIDLNAPAGRNALLRLLAGCDVLLDNFRPDVMDRLGLGWDALHARHPRLIQCSITGFGADGPYRERPAYDTVAQAMSGLLSQILDPERPLIPGPAFADSITGLYAALGIAAALAERASTGQGRRVEVAMVEAMVAFAAEPFANFFQNGRTPGPYDRVSHSQSFALRCADDRTIGIHLSSPTKFWQALLAAIERPDLATDPRFAERAGRVANFVALNDELARVFVTRPRQEWEERLRHHDVPYAPVYKMDEVVADPQLRHLGTFHTLEHPRQGPVQAIRSPIWRDGAREGDDRPPPQLGEHSTDILQEAGFPEEEIAQLRRTGVIG